jgi:hypothetical protein
MKCPRGFPFLKRTCFFCKHFKPNPDSCDHPNLGQLRFQFESDLSILIEKYSGAMKPKKATGKKEQDETQLQKRFDDKSKRARS